MLRDFFPVKVENYMVIFRIVRELKKIGNSKDPDHFILIK